MVDLLIQVLSQINAPLPSPSLVLCLGEHGQATFYTTRLMRLLHWMTPRCTWITFGALETIPSQRILSHCTKRLKNFSPAEGPPAEIRITVHKQQQYGCWFIKGGGFSNCGRRGRIGGHDTSSDARVRGGPRRSRPGLRGSDLTGRTDSRASFLNGAPVWRAVFYMLRLCFMFIRKHYPHRSFDGDRRSKDIDRGGYRGYHGCFHNRHFPRERACSYA